MCVTGHSKDIQVLWKWGSHQPWSWPYVALLNAVLGCSPKEFLFSWCPV